MHLSTFPTFLKVKIIETRATFLRLLIILKTKIIEAWATFTFKEVRTFLSGDSPCIRRWPALICEYRYTSYHASFFGGNSAFVSVQTENCELSKKNHLHFFWPRKFSQHRPLYCTKKIICLWGSLTIRTSCLNCVTMGTKQHGRWFNWRWPVQGYEAAPRNQLIAIFLSAPPKRAWVLVG